jgi:hypothetical protein
MLAVAINMAIATIIWLPPSLLMHGSDRAMPKILLGIGMSTALVVIYSAIAHWCLFWKVNQRHAWTVGIIGGLVILPVVFGALLNVSSSGNNPAFLFSPFLWTSIKQVPGFVSVGVFLALLGAMIWLNLRLWGVLKKIGRSESFRHLATV